MVQSSNFKFKCGLSVWQSTFPAGCTLETSSHTTQQRSVQSRKSLTLRERGQLDRKGGNDQQEAFYVLVCLGKPCVPLSMKWVQCGCLIPHALGRGTPLFWDICEDNHPLKFIQHIKKPHTERLSKEAIIKKIQIIRWVIMFPGSWWAEEGPEPSGLLHIALFTCWAAYTFLITDN